MNSSPLRWLVCLGALLLCGLLAGGRPAMAATNITLFKSFAGNVNFVGTQKTLRTAANEDNPCSVVPDTTTTTATLSGIPTGAVVLSAQLYWAGSSATADNTVTFEGGPVTATAARQYNIAFAANSTTYNFFSAAYDVTAKVVAKRNGTYSFSGLTVTSATNSIYCSAQAVLAGWALAVVYSLPSETFRVLNIYEGFQSIQNSSITLTLSNFNIPALTSGQSGRIAHITWEGDDSLKGGKNLTFNGTAMVDALNPAGNQFNSVSNINNDIYSYGLDFDAYTVSSPVIKAGQTTATTVYSSGQDLVLLSSEIVAVPNTPTADIAITGSLDQTLALGQTAIYTYNVVNNGPGADPGPITFTTTLPAALSGVQVGGDDWTCDPIAGQTITCRYNTLLDNGDSAAPLYLMVMVNTGTSGDTITTTASATGTLFDNVAGNNSATIASTLGIPAYVFTNALCTNKVAFGSNQPCKFITWSNRIAGEVIDKIYITLLNSAGVPTAPTVATTVLMKFGLSCQNPLTNAGTQATFPTSGNSLPLCVGNGATPGTGNYSGNTTFLFTALSPTQATNLTTGMSFVYADAGKVKLYMSDSNGKTGASGPVVMRPKEFILKVYRPKLAGETADLQNPAAADGSGKAFIHAGDLFTMELTATTVDANIKIAKNFGREILPKTVTLVQPDTSPIKDQPNYPLLNGSLNGFVAGVSSGSNYSWDEVGIVNLTPTMSGGDYLGAGNVTGTATNVGRFIPDHFDTVVPVLAPVTPCSAKLTCPATLSGQVYSAQPFEVDVTARHVNGTALQNYAASFARDVTLTAWDAPGSVVQKNPPATPTGAAFNNGTVPSTAFKLGVGSVMANYVLPNAYDNTKPRALNWTAPTQLYVRADWLDSNDAIDVVSSRRVATPVTTPPNTSATVEGGVVIVSGRLLLSNAYGSQSLSMPIGVTAQYWDGANWVTNEIDSSSAFTPKNINFTNCKTATANVACSGVLSVSTAGSVTLSGGRGSFRLDKSGVRYGGDLTLQLNNPSWLPSTTSRAAFGFYKSGPVTYIREIY